MSKMLLHLTLFGEFSLTGPDGTAILLSSKKAKALLAYLALPLGRARGREEVMALLWSERGDAQARASLRQVLTGLRKELGNEAIAALLINDDTLALDAELVSLTERRPGEELLAGFHLHDPAFEEWLRDERIRCEGDEASEIQLTSRDKPSIAVLPFKNLSRDPDQEFFVDGLTEDIITTLAAWRTFPVIARNSTFAYKNQPLDVRSVAADLGAQYVLEGSVRKAGNRLRITAQLVEGDTGKHVWAKRYDRELEDIFAVQDEITVSIVAEVEPEVSKAEILSVIGKRPGNLSAWELYLRGLATMASYRDESSEAKDLFEKSIASDPTFADAYAALAQCHSEDIFALRTADVDASIAVMFDLANKAGRIDPQNFRVHQVLCWAHLWNGDHDRAVETGRKAIELNPSSPVSFERLAAALTHSGNPEEAETCARMCIKLSPVDPELHDYYFQLMQAALGQRHFDEAFEHLAHCLNARPHDTMLLGFKAVLLGHLGRRAEAEACLAEYLSKREIKSAEDYRRIFVPNSALLELNLEGLRKAGWGV